MEFPVVWVSTGGGGGRVLGDDVVGLGELGVDPRQLVYRRGDPQARHVGRQQLLEQGVPHDLRLAPGPLRLPRRLLLLLLLSCATISRRRGEEAPALAALLRQRHDVRELVVELLHYPGMRDGWFMTKRTTLCYDVCGGKDRASSSILLFMDMSECGPEGGHRREMEMAMAFSEGEDLMGETELSLQWPRQIIPPSADAVRCSFCHSP
ncbi:hypothetical protein B296_00039599 [Ensete ventricosum]|uniref:Uncharacterized protein n=1 Tax=Ensete ventricosum TaxID=4639 RepID=A0A426YQ37_ENSVE|nr:hypothetical protein B296_00039599 [Ensete ventricosum]